MRFHESSAQHTSAGVVSYPDTQHICKFEGESRGLSQGRVLAQHASIQRGVTELAHHHFKVAVSQKGAAGARRRVGQLGRRRVPRCSNFNVLPVLGSPKQTKSDEPKIRAAGLSACERVNSDDSESTYWDAVRSSGEA
jgi:hypothetical protein